MPALSVLRPISPPNASISLTRCPLPIPPHCGIARHVRDFVLIDGQQEDPATHPGPGQRRFAPGMPPSDDDDVAFNWTLSIITYLQSPKDLKQPELPSWCGPLPHHLVNLRPSPT